MACTLCEQQKPHLIKCYGHPCPTCRGHFHSFSRPGMLGTFHSESMATCKGSGTYRKYLAEATCHHSWERAARATDLQQPTSAVPALGTAQPATAVGVRAVGLEGLWVAMATVGSLPSCSLRTAAKVYDYGSDADGQLFPL